MKTALNRMGAMLALGAATIAVAPAAFAQQAAQAYPAKPVRVVIPVSAGGLQDRLARVIGQELSKMWGQPVVVDSKPGANGIIAVDNVAKSAPDGYSILMADSAPITINPHLYRKLPYDPMRDLMPVIGMMEVAYLMVAAPSFAPNTLRELFDLARSRPGSVNYASYGQGSSNHLETEAIANHAGVKFTHVPFKGGAALLPPLLSGEIQFALIGVAPALPLIRAGKLKGIVYGASRRSQLLPNVPTISESGVPGYDSRTWFGWFLPAGAPPAIAARVAEDVGRVITEPEFLKRDIIDGGMELLNVHTGKFGDYLRADLAQNGERLKSIPVKLD